MGLGSGVPRSSSEGAPSSLRCVRARATPALAVTALGAQAWLSPGGECTRGCPSWGSDVARVCPGYWVLPHQTAEALGAWPMPAGRWLSEGTGDGTAGAPRLLGRGPSGGRLAVPRHTSIPVEPAHIPLLPSPPPDPGTGPWGRCRHPSLPAAVTQAAPLRALLVPWSSRRSWAGLGMRARGRWSLWLEGRGVTWVLSPPEGGSSATEVSGQVVAHRTSATLRHHHLCAAGGQLLPEAELRPKDPAELAQVGSVTRCPRAGGVQMGTTGGALAAGDLPSGLPSGGAGVQLLQGWARVFATRHLTGKTSKG